jgi:Tat protein secretion system quality control protein TatD with DNase activity
MAVDDWINRRRGVRGVVHSFTGTELEMKELVGFSLTVRFSIK